MRQQLRGVPIHSEVALSIVVVVEKMDVGAMSIPPRPAALQALRNARRITVDSKYVGASLLQESIRGSCSESTVDCQ